MITLSGTFDACESCDRTPRTQTLVSRFYDVRYERLNDLKETQLILKSGMILLLMGLLGATTAHASCQVENKATIPLQVNGGTITLPLAINGIAATFILDTGAQRSVVTEDAVHHLNLARDEWVGTTMRGLGGIERRANANPRSMTLGGIPLVRRTLSHDTSLVVGVLPRTQVGDLVIDGVLGRDYLLLFDLDIDVPGRRMTLYQVHACAGRFLPWQSDYASLPVTLPTADTLVVPVTLDGTPLWALLDTGASASLIVAPGLFRLGLQPASLAGDPSEQASGLGSHTVTMHQHRFHALQVGSQTIDAPIIWVAQVQSTPIVDMILGADWLQERRVWISFTTRQLFLATP